MTHRTLFIVNPISGNGRKEKMLEAIRRYYTAAPYDIVFTEYAGHAIALAHDTDADLVVAVGGDGTVSEVARGIVSGGVLTKTLGILPCGSGDGLALHLGMSRNPRKAVRQLCTCQRYMMDYATIFSSIDDPSADSPSQAMKTQEGTFFCTAGVGFDADVALAFAQSQSRGLWTYISNALRLWRSYEPGHYVVTVDGRTVSGRAVMITVGNAAQWGNNARIAPEASACDGLLDVSFVEPFSSWRIPLLAFRLLTGRLSGTKELKIYKGKSITIERTFSGAAHYDGDSCQMGKEISIKVHPRSINVASPLPSF